MSMLANWCRIDSHKKYLSQQLWIMWIWKSDSFMYIVQKFVDDFVGIFCCCCSFLCWTFRGWDKNVLRTDTCHCLFIEISWTRELCIIELFIKFESSSTHSTAKRKWNCSIWSFDNVQWQQTASLATLESQ